MLTFFIDAGYCISCDNISCNMSYHPECARRGKVYLELRGKVKTFKGRAGTRKDTKKAIVTLVEGSTIDASVEIK